MQQIYISKDGQQHGPYSLEELDEMLQSESISGDDLCWHEGEESWHPISQIPEYVAAPSLSPPPLSSPESVHPQAGSPPIPATSATDKPWYRRTWVHVVLLVFLPFIQVPLMWFLKIFSTPTRIILTIIGIALTIGRLVALNSPRSTTASSGSSYNSSNSTPIAGAVARTGFAASPTAFPTVKAMIESFNDYSTEEGTFQMISEEPLHIQLSPPVFPGWSSEIIDRETKRAMIYGLFRSFAHTGVQKIAVTVVPRESILGGDPKRFLNSRAITITMTREAALEALRRFFPGIQFSDLVTNEDIGGLKLPDQNSKIFDRISFPDQGSPGVDAFFRELTSKNLGGLERGVGL